MSENSENSFRRFTEAEVCNRPATGVATHPQLEESHPTGSQENKMRTEELGRQVEPSICSVKSTPAGLNKLEDTIRQLLCSELPRKSITKPRGWRLSLPFILMAIVPVVLHAVVTVLTPVSSTIIIVVAIIPGLIPPIVADIGPIPIGPGS